jgi:hypothetical protein
MLRTSPARPIAPRLRFTNTVPMNSGQDAGQDLPETADDATEDSTSGSGQAEAVDADAGPLQRSQDAIDHGRDAAQEALKDTLPTRTGASASPEQTADGD